MRILLVHPNYHSGGGDIAGHWPPTWVAYISGALKKAGFVDIRFIDAMTEHMDDTALEALLRDELPDVVMCTAITPAIHKAQDTMRLVRKLHPGATTVLGGIHGTFMYAQVLRDCPEIDYIVRGEGEVVAVNLVSALQAGRLQADREYMGGIAFVRHGEPFATVTPPPVPDLDALTPDWDILNWDRYIYTPLNCRVTMPNFSRGSPPPGGLSSKLSVYRTRDPRGFVDEIEYLITHHHIGFFVLADEEPMRDRDKFVDLCDTLVARDLGIAWGMHTRVADVLRDEELLPLYRQAGLVHVSLRTEEAALLNGDRPNRDIAVADIRKAIQLLRDSGIVSEAQFAVAPHCETPVTLEASYELAQELKPDLVTWYCYTPWQLSEVPSVRGHERVTRDPTEASVVPPIVQPPPMTRDAILAGVLKNYRRFYSRRTSSGYLWDKDPYRRNYLRACLKAYLKSALERQFSELETLDHWGAGKTDEQFEESQISS